MIVRFHRSMLRFYRIHILPESFILFRPFLYILAACALAARATLFLAKNGLDSLRRKLRLV